MSKIMTYNKWLKDNNITVGSKVKVVHRVPEHRLWIPQLDEWINTTAVVVEIDGSDSIHLRVSSEDIFLWVPIDAIEPVPEKPDTIIITGGTDEEPILKKSLQTIQYVDLSSGSSNKPLKKENKMKTLNRIRALARRLTMAWDLYGVFLLLRLAHPLVTRLWSRIGIPVDTVADREVAPWILTVLTVGASVFTILGLHKLAAWYYGERK